MAKYHLAPSLAQLRSEFNSEYPGRDKASDGWIGDPSHAARTSDHNPDYSLPDDDPRDGVVRALDVDKDLFPGSGAEFARLVEHVADDPRLKYAIFNGRIKNPGMPWRKYTGSNSHASHAHLSLKHTAQAELDLTRWLPGPAPAKTVPGVQPAPPAPFGAALPPWPGNPSPAYGGYNRPEFERRFDGYVREIQAAMNRTNLHPKLYVDGFFGPRTEAAVDGYQGAQKLVVDGIVGPRTYASLKKVAG